MLRAMRVAPRDVLTTPSALLHAMVSDVAGSSGGRAGDSRAVDLTPAPSSKRFAVIGSYNEDAVRVIERERRKSACSDGRLPRMHKVWHGVESKGMA